MKFTKEQFKKLEELSKLRLSVEDELRYATDIEGVLAYAEELSAVDTTGVLPTSQVTGLSNIQRTDDVTQQELESGSTLLAHSNQEVEMKQIKVPNVL